MEEKNICIIIPGFIKSYNHLYYLKKIFSKLDANIYFFGYIFDYMIHPCAYRNNISYDHDKNEKLFIYHGDLMDSSNIHRLLMNIKPDEVYNLGAQSHVAVSFEVPEYTADVDGLGAIRLLDAVRDLGTK